MTNFEQKNSLDIVHINSENSISLKFCIKKRELYNLIIFVKNLFLQICIKIRIIYILVKV